MINESFTAALSLVPCGGTTNFPDPCTPCHLWLLADNIINFILLLSLPILVIALLYGGILWLISVGNAAQVQRGKAIIFNALVGVLIAFLAWLIVDSLIKTLASGKPIAAWNDTPDCGPAIPYTPGPGPTPTPIVTTTPIPTTSLQCSASTISPLIQSVIDCTRSQAASSGLSIVVTSVNTGSHTCDLSKNPPNISCHYGGTACNGTGHAADFALTSAKTAATWAKAVQIINTCGGRARCETSSAPYITSCANPAVTHVHANSSQSCGCN